MDLAWKLKEVSDQGMMMTLLALADFADDEGECWPSIPAIAAKSRATERTVYNHIGKFIKMGLITKLPGGGRGNRNSYRLNLTVKPVAFSVRNTETENPELKNPVSKNPESGDSKTLNLTTLNPEFDDSAIRKNRQEPSIEPSYKKQAVKVPAWMPEQSWSDYKAMRIKIRKPMTVEAERLAILKLDSLRNRGHPPELVLQQSIFNSWQGLFELKDGNYELNAKRSSGGTVSKAEQRRDGNIRAARRAAEIMGLVPINGARRSFSDAGNSGTAGDIRGRPDNLSAVTLDGSFEAVPEGVEVLPKDRGNH